MSDILISIGGSGAGSDECTVTKDKVLSGQTYIGADTNDEPIAGTMSNQGAKTATLNAGGSYTIPAGYHIGAGKVTANTLSGQTAGTAVAANIRNGKTAWVNGAKVTGNMPEQVGSTITPGTANKTVVAANRYVTGNIIVAGDPDLIAGNILNGKNIFNVVGNVRKYGIWKGRKTATSKADFDVVNGTTASFYYLSVTVDFTPISICAACSSSDYPFPMTVYDGFNYAVSPGKNVKATGNAVIGKTFKVPVEARKGGTNETTDKAYDVVVCGYY